MQKYKFKKQGKNKTMSHANKVLERNKLKHPERHDKRITYYGVGTRDGKQVFVGEAIAAMTEVEALIGLQEVANKEGIANLMVKPLSNNKFGKFRYNNY